MMPVYLDCNATTPLIPAVRDEVLRYLVEEFGNSGSRTHEYGARAKQAIERARQQVAAVVNAKPDEVLFTSGATESNNLAILGLAAHGRSDGRMHVLSTAVEHKAVLEPLEYLQKTGFEVELLEPTDGGWVDPASVASRLREDTVLVSVMHVNNETGIVQPLSQISDVLTGHPAFFHVDAAQGFGKELEQLRASRIDLISASGHKIHAPKGVGALIARRRGFSPPPLTPLAFGGGQERGLRPGTLPVPQIVGLGLAAELAVREHEDRRHACLRFRRKLLQALEPLDPVLIGDQARCLPHVASLAIPGVDSEAAIVGLKAHVAISNGAACTSKSYTQSHVLQAMRLSEEVIRGALRFSWCHLTEEPSWEEVRLALESLKQ